MSASKWCMVQSDDRTVEQLQSMADLMRRNEEACRSFGNCKYLPDPMRGREEVSPYWRKVHAVKACLQDRDCGKCLYLDSDAVVVRGHFHKGSVDELLGSKDVGFAPDWGRDRMNAGVFAVRASKTGKKIVDEWLSHESTRWSTDAGGAWRCIKQGGEDCDWAGEEYEQGAFISKVAPRHESSLNETSPYTWDNDTDSNCNGKVKHFMGRKGIKEQVVARYLHTSEHRGC